MDRQNILMHESSAVIFVEKLSRQVIGILVYESLLKWGDVSCTKVHGIVVREIIEMKSSYVQEAEST